MSESPAEYVQKLEADNKRLRAELIVARKELDEAGLTVARLVLEKEAMLKRLSEPDFTVEDVTFHGGPS